MKDIDEAIQHCEDVAQQQDMLKGRYDDASGYNRSGNEAIRTSDAKKCEKCADDHRQLAEWLKDYKRLLEQQSCEDAISRQSVLNLINADWKYEGLEEDVSSLPPVNPQPKYEDIAKAFQLGISFGFIDGLANKTQESEDKE